jgi:hypothetical protein
VSKEQAGAGGDAHRKLSTGRHIECGAVTGGRLASASEARVGGSRLCSGWERREKGEEKP